MAKKRILYKAEIGLPELERQLLQRTDSLELMPIKEDYRYAYSLRQAWFLFEKIYPPDSILRVTKEIRDE